MQQENVIFIDKLQTLIKRNLCEYYNKTLTAEVIALLTAQIIEDCEQFLVIDN